MMVYKGSPSLSGLRDVRGSLARADMGGVLNTRELLEIAGVLQSARAVRAYGMSAEKETCIDHLFKMLQTNRFLEDKIVNSIPGEDEIAAGMVSCKNMTTGAQTKLPVADAILMMREDLAERNKGKVIVE